MNRCYVLVGWCGTLVHFLAGDSEPFRSEYLLFQFREIFWNYFFDNLFPFFFLFCLFFSFWFSINLLHWSSNAHNCSLIFSFLFIFRENTPQLYFPIFLFLFNLTKFLIFKQLKKNFPFKNSMLTLFHCCNLLFFKKLKQKNFFSYVLCTILLSVHFFLFAFISFLAGKLSSDVWRSLPGLSYLRVRHLKTREIIYVREHFL